MVSQIAAPAQLEVIYSDCDGQLVANNTIQFPILVEIQQNWDYLFANAPNIFVDEDLFWYPVEGKNTLVEEVQAII